MVPQMVDECSRMVEATVLRSEVQIRADMSEELRLTPMMGFEPWLKQMLMNYLSNAAKVPQLHTAPEPSAF